MTFCITKYFCLRVTTQFWFFNMLKILFKLDKQKIASQDIYLCAYDVTGFESTFFLFKLRYALISCNLQWKYLKKYHIWILRLLNYLGTDFKLLICHYYCSQMGSLIYQRVSAFRWDCLRWVDFFRWYSKNPSQVPNYASTIIIICSTFQNYFRFLDINASRIKLSFKWSFLIVLSFTCLYPLPPPQPLTFSDQPHLIWIRSEKVWIGRNRSEI